MHRPGPGLHPRATCDEGAPLPGWSIGETCGARTVSPRWVDIGAVVAMVTEKAAQVRTGKRLPWKRTSNTTMRVTGLGVASY